MGHCGHWPLTGTVLQSHTCQTLCQTSYPNIFYRNQICNTVNPVQGYCEDSSTDTSREVSLKILMSVSDFQNRSEHVSDDSNSIGVMPTKFCSGNVSCHNHRNENKSQSPECKEFVIIGRWSKSRLSHIKQIVYNCRQWSQWYRALLHVVRTLAILHWSVSG